MFDITKITWEDHDKFMNFLSWFFKRADEFRDHGTIEEYEINPETASIMLTVSRWEGHCGSCMEQRSSKIDIPAGNFFTDHSAAEFIKDEKEQEKHVETLKLKEEKRLADAAEIIRLQKVAEQKELNDQLEYKRLKAKYEGA